MLKSTNLYLFVILSLLIAPVAVLAQENDMLRDVAIPLMDGLTENNEGSMLFDSPGGRIIYAEASGQNAAKDVHIYYSMALPSLEWSIDQSASCDPNLVFCIKATRGTESLLLDISVTNNKTIISYSLVPK